MSKVASATTSESISYREARNKSYAEEDNDVPLTTVPKYVMADSLIRVGTGLPKTQVMPFNKRLPAVVAIPSPSQERMRCDACAGKHRQTNVYCSGNRKQKRVIPKGMALRIKDKVLISLRLEDIHLLRGRKKGRAYVTRV